MYKTFSFAKLSVTSVCKPACHVKRESALQQQRMGGLTCCLATHVAAEAAETHGEMSTVQPRLTAYMLPLLPGSFSGRLAVACKKAITNKTATLPYKDIWPVGIVSGAGFSVL